MPKVKYYFDQKSLSYRVVKRTPSAVIKQVSLFLFVAFTFGFLCISTLFQYIDTPEEMYVKREYEYMLYQYSILDKKINQAQSVLESLRERDNNLYRVFFETRSIPKEQVKLDLNNTPDYLVDLDKFEIADMVVSIRERLDKLLNRIVIQSHSLDEIADLAKEKEQILSSIPAIQPVRNVDLSRMASGYGWRIDPFTKVRKMHYGMDFTAPRGTHIFATGDGEVIRADSRSTGYGKHVRIKHASGHISLYAHMSAYAVKKGEQVRRGDLIGYVGSTGRSQAPHIHYEVMKGRKRINPVHFYYGNLAPEEYEAIVRKASQENQSLD